MASSSITPNVMLKLRSPNPTMRREAVITLGRMGVTGALPHLADVIQNDPLPELRQLAHKAGQHINHQRQKRAAASQKPPVLLSTPTRNRVQAPPRPEAARTLKAPPRKVMPFTTTDFEFSLDEMSQIASETTSPSALAQTGSDGVRPLLNSTALLRAENVSGQAQQRAAICFDRAMMAHLQGDMVKAVSELARALQINPGLASEPVPQNLARALTGMPPQIAIEALQNPERRREIVAEFNSRRA